MPVTIQDLINTQNDIDNHRIDDHFAPQIVEAELMLNRDIEIEWFKPVADSKDGVFYFDAAKLLDQDGLKRAKVYKSLELCYLRLSRGATDESFYLKMEEYKMRYDREIDIIKNHGISYDWNGSGDLQQIESGIIRTRRRIVRF
jgi:hypothetical protein